jgi:hypothetical protein
MANVLNTLGHVGLDIVHAIEVPFKFIIKADKVLNTVVKDQPELASVLATLVQKAEEVGAASLLAGSDKGLNLAEDAAALAQVEAFFAWFKATVVPEIEKVFDEIKTDLAATSVSPVVPAAPTATVA